MNPNRRIDATGTRRRLNALVATGWHTTTIAADLGVTKQRVHQWRHARRVTATTAHQVAQLYEHRRHQPGPARHRLHHRTLHAAHPPPDAWTGVDIDDPDARPRTAGDEQDGQAA